MTTIVIGVDATDRSRDVIAFARQFDTPLQAADRPLELVALLADVSV